MGKRSRFVAAAILVAGSSVAGLTPATALAQTGAAGGLSSPTGETSPPPSEGAVPAPTGEPTGPAAPGAGPQGYVPAPPGYGAMTQPTAPYPDRPVSTVDRTPKHVGNLLSVVGAAIFANSYLTVALAGLYGGPEWIFVPVIGPFAMIAEDDVWNEPIWWIDGILQVVGATALAVGLGLRFSFDESPDDDGAEVALAPWVGPGAGGLGLSGSF